MPRAFASTMGCLGMAVTLLRGAKNIASPDAVLFDAVGAMIVFAVVGAVVGAIAQSTVDEAIRRRLEEQLVEGPPATR